MLTLLQRFSFSQGLIFGTGFKGLGLVGFVSGNYGSLQDALVLCRCAVFILYCPLLVSTTSDLGFPVTFTILPSCQFLS